MTPRVSTSVALFGLFVAAAPAGAGEYPYPVAVERSTAPTLELAAPVADPSMAVGTAGARAPSVVEPLAAGTDPAGAPVELARPAVADPVPSGGRAAIGGDAGRSIALTISDDVANVTYQNDADSLGVDQGRVQAGFLLSEQRDIIFSGTLLLDTRPGLVPQVRLSAGARGYAALLGAENRDAVAFGLGVEGAYTLPVRVLPLELTASAFYAPDVLSFGQADRIIDWNVDVGLQLRDQLAAFAGLRFLQVDTRPGSREVEDEVHIGVRWTLERSADDEELLFDGG